MTLRHIRIFIAVCEAGSVTKAGELMHIAQPSVSLAIKELEEYYSVQLFDRIARRLYLTETGRQFLDYAKYIISTFDELEENVQSFEGRGSLKIGASMTIGTFYLPEYIREFKRMYPNIRVEVVVDNSGYIVDKVSNNQVDIGLMIGLADDKRVKFIPFMKEELVIVSHPDYLGEGDRRLGIDQISQVDWLLRESGSALREMFDGYLHTKGLQVKPLWESLSNQALLEGVKAGLGIGIMARSLVQADLQQGRLIEMSIEGIELKRQLHMIHHQNKYLTKSMMDFMEIVMRLSMDK